MLRIGFHAPLFALKNQNGQHRILRDKAGSPCLILVYASDTIPGCPELALALASQAGQLRKLGCSFLSLSADGDRSALASQVPEDFDLLSDTGLEIIEGLGALARNGDHCSVTRSLFLLDSNLRILQTFAPLESAQDLQGLAQKIRPLIPRPRQKPAPFHAPVLQIPRVLSPAYCRHLMEVWEERGHQDSGFMVQDPKNPGRTLEALDPKMKVRRDHFVRDDDLLQEIDQQVAPAVFPELEKAFAYKATRREPYKIACYPAQEGGHFHAHRDNTTPGTRHRVWAMSVNLNSEDYEGGELCFPEYGLDLYRPGTGEAVIFSCSLLHKALPVTRGNRFVLLSFLYNEEGADNYERARQELQKQALKG